MSPPPGSGPFVLAPRSVCPIHTNGSGHSSLVPISLLSTFTQNFHEGANCDDLDKSPHICHSLFIPLVMTGNKRQVKMKACFPPLGVIQDYLQCWVILLSNLYYETPCWTQNAFFSFAKGSEDLESVMNTDLLRSTVLHSTLLQSLSLLSFLLLKKSIGRGT